MRLSGDSLVGDIDQLSGDIVNGLFFFLGHFVLVCELSALVLLINLLGHGLCYSPRFRKLCFKGSNAVSAFSDLSCTLGIGTVEFANGNGEGRGPVNILQMGNLDVRVVFKKRWYLLLLVADA